MMELLPNRKSISNPTILGFVILTAFSIFFVLSYNGFSYIRYLKTYQQLQENELTTLNQEVEDILRNLTELIDLSSTRISKASTRSIQHKSATIQEILRSLPYLQPSSTYLPIQKIAFYKLSYPQMLITRLGELKVDLTKVPTEQMLSQSQKTTFFLKDKFITGRINVLNASNHIEGILEIQIDYSEFKNILGKFQTIEIDEEMALKDSLLLLKTLPIIPLLIYSKKPNSFGDYILGNQSNYLIFLIYLMIFLTILGFCLRYISRHIFKIYHHKIVIDEDRILTLEGTKETLNTNLSKLQKEFDLYKVSNHTQNSFGKKLKKKQELQLSNITILLNEFLSLKKPLNTLVESQYSMKLDDCYKQLLALSNGLWYPKSQDNVSLKEIIENILLMFSHKIHQSNISYETSLPPKLSSFKGDHLLIELILTNIIGKSIYRVFDNGTVLISVKKTPVLYRIEIKDDGYDRMLFTETQIEKSCDIFLNEDDFNILCRENGLYVKYSKARSGFNVTSLVIPLPSQEELPKNVVPLFQ